MLRLACFVEPAVFRDDPLLLSYWALLMAKCAAASAGRLEMQLISSGAIVGVAREAFAQTFEIDSRAILDGADGDLIAYARDVSLGDGKRNFVLGQAISEAMDVLRPDAILSWTENAYLRQAGSSRPVLFTELGPLSRSHARTMIQLDPFGHQRNSAFDRMAAPLWDPTRYQQLARRWQETWGGRLATEAASSGLYEWARPLPLGRRLLFAMQPNGWLTYEGVGPSAAPLSLLADLAAAEPDVIVIPQWHPGQALDWMEATAVARRFKNIILPPKHLARGMSDHLTPLVDEVATISSNVAVNAVVQGKAVRLLGEGKFSTLADNNQRSMERPDLLAFLLERYCRPLDFWTEGVGGLANDVEAMIAAPEDLLAAPEGDLAMLENYLGGA